MDAYYANQASLPHFSSRYYRQRGSGFGALAAGIGRFALPFSKNIFLPAAKKIGKELFFQGAPELVDVITKKKTPRQAARETVRKTVKRQLGRGGPRVPRHSRSKVSRRKQLRKSSTRGVGQRKQRTAISKRRKLQRSRDQFFSKLKNDY